MTISKEINRYQHDHILKAKAYKENGQRERECVHWQQTTMRYQKMGLMHKNEHKICHTHH